MNSQKIFQRIRWNFIIAIYFSLTIAVFAVGMAYAATNVGMNDDPPDAFPQSPLDDGEWGDLPYAYPIMQPPGYMHAIDDGLMLGTYKDYENLPQPDDYAGAGPTGGDDNNPVGDPDDEDGVFRNMNESWLINATVHITVTVDGCTDGTCYLNGWIDWGNDLSFVDDQIFSDVVVNNGTHTLGFTIPSDRGYNVGDDIFAHFRLCDSPGLIAAGGCNEPGGHAANGEVEDYFWTFNPTAVELVSIEATTNYAVPFALLAGALILLFSGGAILAFKRSRV